MIQSKMHIEICSGPIAAPDVDRLYERNNRAARARPDDLFFIVRRQGSVVAAVRYCEEEGVSLLRSMIVDEPFQRQGIGQILLIEFERYLNLDSIKDCWCIAYEPLQTFYRSIGFTIQEASEAPELLQKRTQEHNLKKPQNPVVILRRFV